MTNWFKFNPLVVRFVRSGFRKGKGSFHLWVTASLLVLMVLVNTALYHFRDSFAMRPPYPEFSDYCSSLFWQMLGFNTVHLAVFGLFRIYGVAMREKTEETLEFLRVSTLSSPSIVLGMVFGLQVPGYLLLVVTLPLSLLCVFGGGVPFATFASTHAFLLAISFFVSLLGVYLGWRFEKRSADALILLTIIGSLIASGALIEVAKHAEALRQILTCLHPIALCMYVSEVQQMSHDIEFLGVVVHPAIVGSAFYVLLSLFLMRVMMRFVVLGDRYRVSVPLGLYGQICVLSLGIGLLPVFLTSGEGLVMRSVWISLSTIMLFHLSAGRAMHGEHFMLSCSHAGDQRSPLQAQLISALPFAAVHILADASMSVRLGGGFDVVPGLLSAGLVVGTSLATGAAILGSKTPPGTSKNGLFWLITVAPLLGGLITIAFGDLLAITPALAIMSVSPAAAGVLAVHREVGDIATAWSTCATVAIGATIALLALAFMAGSGHHQRLLSIARKMAERAKPERHSEMLPGEAGPADAEEIQF